MHIYTRRRQQRSSALQASKQCHAPSGAPDLRMNIRPIRVCAGELLSPLPVSGAGFYLPPVGGKQGAPPSGEQENTRFVSNIVPMTSTEGYGIRYSTVDRWPAGPRTRQLFILEQLQQQ